MTPNTYDGPRAGDFAVIRSKGRVARWLIRFGQWLNGDGFHDYEHAILYLGGNNIIEARGEGAVIRPAPDVLTRHRKDVVWSSMDLGFHTRVRICLAARKYEGTPYGFLDYFALALHRFHIPIPRLKKFIQNTKSMICSQLVDQTYMDAGVHLFEDRRWPGFVTPGDLYHVIKGDCK